MHMHVIFGLYEKRKKKKKQQNNRTCSLYADDNSINVDIRMTFLLGLLHSNSLVLNEQKEPVYETPLRSVTSTLSWFTLNVCLQFVL